MAKSQILDYFIHLTDRDLVESLQAQILAGTGPGALIVNPDTGTAAIYRAPGGNGATVEFAAPVQEEGSAFTAPCIRSPWFVPGTNNFPRDVATFTRKSGGWFGLPILFGTTTRFYWAGHPVYAQPAAVQDGDGVPIPRPARIPQRYHLSPGEFGSTGEGATGSMYWGPAAGRHPGQWGYLIRNAGVSSPLVTQQYYNDLTVHTVWDRFYVRVLRLPAARVSLWASEQVAQSGQGFVVELASNGALIFSEKDTGAVLGSYDAGLLADRVWHRLDLCLLYVGADGPPAVRVGKLEVFLSGESVAKVAHSNMLGTPALCVVNNTILGKTTAEVQTGEVDIANYRGADIPEDKNPTIAEWDETVTYVIGDVVQTTAQWVYPSEVVAFYALQGSLNAPPGTNPLVWARLGHSKDWVNGSRIQIVRPTAAAGDHANWTGDFRLLLNRDPTSQAADLDGLTSTTSGAVLSMTTDAPDLMTLPGALGITSFAIALHGYRGTSDGTLGYNLNGTGAVMTAITQPTVGAAAYDNDRILYAPAAMDNPVAVTSLVLRHVKGADVGAAAANQLAAVAEVIGIFGPEDPPLPTTGEPVVHVFPSFHAGQHNAPYANSPWARSDARALAPIGAIAGTYVGNATCTELLFRVPVHCLWVRRVTGTGDTGWRWFSSHIGGFVDFQEGVLGNVVARAEVDPTFVPGGGEDDQAQRYRVRITGDHAQVNANTVTYQYIALSDAGARLMMAGAFLKDDTALALTLSVALAEATFVPLAMLAHSASRSTTVSNTGTFKGHGHAANAGVTLPTTSAAAVCTFAAGRLEAVGANLVTSDPEHIAYLLFRLTDSSGAANTFVGLTSYTGDGSASRTINLSPATGLRPLFALVVGDGGASSTYFRDPSHTTTTSTNLASGTVSSTGITSGGLDQLSVGSSLNTNGILFSVLVVWGSATAGNGGWSGNGEFLNMEPDVEGPDEPTIITPPTDDPGPDDPPEDPEVPVIAADCVSSSTSLVNQALSHIGVSQQIAAGALLTEASREAATARLHYQTEIDAVLRAHPWKFATTYADLVTLGGTAATSVNLDWQYSYRLPTDCVKVRRVVKNDGTKRGYDVAPVPFDVTEDATGGGVIYCDLDQAVAPAAATITIEYTRRPACAARVRDPIFRSAVSFRLGHAFAPGLSRSAEFADTALRNYLLQIGVAAAEDQNEAEPQARENAGEPDWITGR